MMQESQETMEPTKVYELAKELGVDSLSLLDELKALNIQVKNHMSDLSPIDVVRVKDAHAPKKAPVTSAKKTTTLKKKAAPTSTPAVQPAKPAAAKAAPAKPAAALLKKKAKPTAPTEDAAAKAKSSSTVIRRRLREDGATETVTSTTTTRKAEEEAAVGAALAAHQAALQEVAPPPEQIIEAPVEMKQEDVVEIAPEIQEVFIEEIPTELKSEPLKIQPSALKSSDKKLEVTTTRRVTITPAKLESKSSLRVIMPAAPKPLIRTGAQIITPGSRSRPGGVVTPQTTESRIRINAKTGKEEEAELAKKAPKVDREAIKPEDVRFADYRKTEKTFLPKRKKVPVGKSLNRTKLTTPSAHKRVIEVNGTITVSDFAKGLGVKGADVIKKLMGLGQTVTLNQAIDLDTATLLASEFQFEVKDSSFKEEAHLETKQDAEGSQETRPPVVTIMGHVDHGKTTLLDAIREANVAGGEAGGITQHIGAYTIEKNGRMITFIDTPGHEAFSVMRARGANVTDIVVLVVSADDGVMPQTREAVSHAQAAKVPIIVAVNKIDKPGANPERIKQGLAEINLLAEDWGGETMFVPVSALQKTNLDKLLESILLQADVLDLKANAEAAASGSVLESRLEKGRGPVASVLVKRGTLRVGDWMGAGSNYGKVKAMIDHLGNPIVEVKPGMAAEVLGLNGVPGAGEAFHCAADEDSAREIAEHRIQKAKETLAASRTGKMSLEDLFSKIQSGESKELRVILKSDVFGSSEAIRDSLVKLSTDKVKLNVMHTAIGGITESDVMLASASDAIIIGFNVRPETMARKVAEMEGVEIKTYSIIYELIDDVKLAMTGLLEKKKVEKFLGRAEVRQTFSVPKIGVIAGCSVVDGKILRNANARLLRDSRVIFTGKLGSLKRFKDDAKEVAQGFECGISLEGYNDLKVGDLIESYQIDLIAQELDSA